MSADPNTWIRFPNSDKLELIIIVGGDTGVQGYIEEKYTGPAVKGSQRVSTPHAMQSTTIPRNTNYVTAKNQMLGSEGRSMHMNTSAVTGTHPMSNVIYGFRPESGWAGVLFQVFLHGPFVSNWQKQKELDFWILFQGIDVPAVLFEMESEVDLPGMGRKRYILQCIVPELLDIEDRCSVTLTARGLGGRRLLLEDYLLAIFSIDIMVRFCFFILRVDHSLITYDYGKNLVALLRWLKGTPPNDIDYPAPVIRAKLLKEISRILSMSLNQRIWNCNTHLLIIILSMKVKLYYYLLLIVDSKYSRCLILRIGGYSQLASRSMTGFAQVKGES